MPNLVQIHCSTSSVILKAMTTQYTRSNSTYHGPPLTSAMKASLFTMRIPVHSPWLPGYIDVVQTVLIMLTIVGLFPDKPCYDPITLDYSLSKKRTLTLFK